MAVITRVGPATPTPDQQEPTPPSALWRWWPVLVVAVLVILVGVVLAITTDQDSDDEQRADTALSDTSTTIVSSPPGTSTPEVVATPPGTEAPADVISTTPTIPPTTEATAGTPLSKDILAVLEEYCAQPDDDTSVFTMESFFDEAELESGPPPGGTPDHATDPPSALHIEYVGAARAGCKDAKQVMVLARLAGPPDDVQVSLALDFPSEPGHQADPAALAAIGQTPGWNQYHSLDKGVVVVLDEKFEPADTTAMFYAENNLVVFVQDVSPDHTEVGYIVQTFFRDGTTAESPVAWYATSGNQATPN